MFGLNALDVKFMGTQAYNRISKQLDQKACTRNDLIKYCKANLAEGINTGDVDNASWAAESLATLSRYKNYKYFALDHYIGNGVKPVIVAKDEIIKNIKKIIEKRLPSMDSHIYTSTVLKIRNWANDHVPDYVINKLELALEKCTYRGSLMDKNVVLQSTKKPATGQQFINLCSAVLQNI